MKTKSVLLDSSAWIISFQKNTSTPLKDRIKKYISTNEVVISEVIILELLQGCRDSYEKDSLQQSLESLAILPLEQKVWKRAYELGFNLRRKGVTIPTIDVLIAALAIENKCCLFHKDRHFCMVSEHFKELQEEYLE